MVNVELLINRFVESPDSLEEEECAALVQALEDSPDLAEKLREQLVLDELLAQKLDPERSDFRAQIDQRLTDLAKGELELDKQIDAMRELAIGQLRQPREASGSGWRLAAIAATLLIAAGLATYFAWPLPSPVAKVSELQGSGTLHRGGIQTALSSGTELRDGDRLVTAAGGQVHIAYDDGTWVRIFDETTAHISREGRSGAKRVYLDQGRLTSRIAPQPASLPMLFISPNATAKVVGTEIWLSVDKQSTELQVTEGKVEFWRSDAPQVVVVDPGKVARATSGTLDIKQPLWPAERRSLVFAFSTGTEPAVVRDGKTGVLHSTRLIGHGDTGYGSRGGLKLVGGSFAPEDTIAGRHLLEACRKTNEITVEAVLRSERPEQMGLAQIVSFGASREVPTFSLGQEGNALVWRFKTDAQGDREFTLAKLLPRKTTHCLVSYRGGSLVCYLDGAKVFEDAVVTSGFANWLEQPLVFGADSAGANPWHGTLEGLAIYNRFFSEEDARRSAAAFQSEFLHAPADSNWRDLLPLANAGLHVVGGTWVREPDSWHGAAADGSRLMLPLVPDGNYELQVEFTRKLGEAPLQLIFPVGQTQAQLVLDGGREMEQPHCGFALIDGKPSHDNAATLRETVLETGKRHKAEISVVTSGARCHVQVKLDDQPLLAWSGDIRSLTLDSRMQVPDPRCAALISGGRGLFFHAARLKMTTGQATE